MRLILVEKEPGGTFARLRINVTAIAYDGGLAWIDAVRAASPGLATPSTIAIFADEPDCDYPDSLLHDPVSSIATMFPTAAKAERYMRSRRWPNGPQCPTCRSYSVHPRVIGGKDFKCGKCDAEFTVTTGTILHYTHVALHKWLYAFQLFNVTNGGISAVKLAHRINIGRRTATTLLKRIREIGFEVAPHASELTAIEIMVDCALKSTRSKPNAQARKPNSRRYVRMPPGHDVDVQQ